MIVHVTTTPTPDSGRERATGGMRGGIESLDELISRIKRIHDNRGGCRYGLRQVCRSVGVGGCWGGGGATCCAGCAEASVSALVAMARWRHGIWQAAAEFGDGGRFR